MSFSKLQIAKAVASGIVGLGTTKIVSKVIKAHITPETIVDKVTVTAAAWAIGGVVGQHTKKYTNDMIDETVKNVGEVIDRIKVAEKLNRINRGQATFESEGLDKSNFVMKDGKWARVEKTVAEGKHAS